jgi:hypothetical protein
MTTQNGILSGSIQKNNVKPGAHNIKLYGFTGAKWEKNSADISETLLVNIFSEGMDGQSVTIQFYEGALNNPGTLIDTKETKISGDQTDFQWKLPQDKLKNLKASKRPSMPRYYFIANVKKLSRSMTSLNFLDLTTTVKISLLDDQKKVVANEPFTIKLATGAVITSKTDRNGKAEIKKVPIGVHNIQFTKNPLIAPDKPICIESLQRSSGYSIDVFNENTYYTNNCVIRCSHKINEHYRYVLNPPFYEIVQDAPKYSSLGPAGDRKPLESDLINIYTNVKKQLSEQTGKKIIEKPAESGYLRYDLECLHEQKKNSELFFLPEFWKQLKNPLVLNVNGLRNTIPVKIYKPDQYALSIQFPAIQEFSAGAKLTKEYHSGLVSNAPKYVSKPLKCEDKSWSFKEGLPFTGDKPVNYKINNREVAISAFDALGSMLLMITQFQKIITLIKEDIPEAGFYVEFRQKLFEGTFSIEWGWKEYQDHRAFMRMAAILDVTLIGISFELGIGVSGLSFKLQIFALLEGKVGVSFNGERVSPDNAVELVFPIKTTIEGSVGARFEAGYIVKIEGKVTTGIEIKGQFKINTTEGVSIGGNIDWTGIKATLTASANVAKSAGNKEFSKDDYGKVETNTLGSNKREYTLINSAPLGQFQWPSQEKYVPTFVPREKVIEKIKSVFTKGYNVRVRDAKDNEIDLDKLANIFADYIDKWKDIERSERSIEAIAFSIRTHLLSLATKPTWHSLLKSVEHYAFVTFCHTELTKILNKAINPAIAAMNKLKP